MRRQNGETILISLTVPALRRRPLVINTKGGIMTKIWGGILAVTGFIACPCHLPLTVPLFLGVLGGTGVGSFVGTHAGLFYGLATGYLIAAVAVGIYLWPGAGEPP